MIIKLPKNCKKRPKLPKILKVETIFNYPILCQSASINRWRHWKTRDLGVWHQASKAVKDAILKVSSIVLSVKITSNIHNVVDCVELDLVLEGRPVRISCASKIESSTYVLSGAATANLKCDLFWIHVKVLE